jgi:hypothetical protein
VTVSVACNKVGIRMELVSDELADLAGQLDATAAGPALERRLIHCPTPNEKH